MAPLSASDVLRIWEIGASLDPAHRALAILEAASPGAHAGALAALPVGRRDLRLLEIREETFGSRLNAALSCPRCAERVEFELETSDLLARAGAGIEATESEVRIDDWSLRYRMPTAGDLAEAAGCREPGRALALLVERCVLEANRGGEPAPPEEIPPHAIALLDGGLARQDPLAEVLLDFVCPACGEAGQTLFDIGCYLWEELRAQAVRLLYEVHTLARSYGWREPDILA
ncbi:MAG: phage baseplate protein, partial [Actinomycetota bacterium]